MQIFAFVDTLMSTLPPLNVPPAAPPGLAEYQSKALSFVKWLAIAFAGLCAVVAVGQIAGGRTGRSQMGVQGLTGVGWVLLSLAGISTIGVIIAEFLRVS